MKQELQGVFVIYSRKSKFTGKGESVENQVEMCRNYIASVYGPEAAEAALVYEDEGFSGGNLERPQFKKMMKDSHEQKFAAIVVYRLDRISRNIGDFAKLIEDLGDRKIDFISIREQFDTSSPMGRAMMYIASVFSQLERETIAERIRDNMHELAKTGRWLGGNTPTGYESEGVTSVAVDGKTKKAYKLKPIPEEISLVKKIFDLFMETGSLTKVDQYLLERQIKTKTGKNFSRFSIRAILANPVYMIADEDAYDYMVENQADLFSEKDKFDGVHGIMAYNRTLQRPGQANKTNPIDEWIVAVGKHPGIIPGAAWIAVQEKLELNKVKSYRGPRGNVALLSGLLYCGHCGDYMRPKVTNRKNAQGETIYTYMCTMKERSRGQVCKIKNVSGNLLDAKIVQAVKDLGRNSDEMAQQIMQTKRVLRGDLEGYNAQLEEVRTQIEETDRQVKGLVDTLSRTTGTSAEKYIVERIDELNKASDAQRRRLEELESLTKQHELADMEFDIIQNMLANFSEGIENYSVEQKRAAIRAVVKKVVWDGENVHLYLFGRDGDVDFPEIPAKNGENETFSESESAWREDSECQKSGSMYHAFLTSGGRKFLYRNFRTTLERPTVRSCLLAEL